MLLDATKLRRKMLMMMKAMMKMKVTYLKFCLNDNSVEFVFLKAFTKSFSLRPPGNFFFLIMKSSA